MKIYQVTYRETIHYEPTDAEKQAGRSATDTPRNETRKIAVEGNAIDAHAKTLTILAARTFDSPGTTAKDIEIMGIALLAEAE